MSLSADKSKRSFFSTAKSLIKKKEFFKTKNVPNGDLMLNELIIATVKKYRLYIDSGDFVCLSDAINNPFIGGRLGDKIMLLLLKNHITFPIMIKKNIRKVNDKIKHIIKKIVYI